MKSLRKLVIISIIFLLLGPFSAFAALGAVTSEVAAAAAAKAGSTAGKSTKEGLYAGTVTLGVVTSAALIGAVIAGASGNETTTQHH